MNTEVSFLIQHWLSEPEFWIRNHLIRIRIRTYPAFQVNPDTDPDPIRLQGLDDQKEEKNPAEKLFIFYNQNCNLLIPRPPYRTALKAEHPALQKGKFINFFLFLWIILLTWIRIRIWIHGPHCIQIQTGSVSGFTTLPEPETDQKKCVLLCATSPALADCFPTSC